jgi:hypothetical protein
MNNKICSICKISQPRENFYKLKSKNYKPEWDCRDSCCKKCKSISTTIKRQQLKAAAVEYKGGKCLDCGLQTQNYCVYDFHHLDPTKKDFSFSSSYSKSLKQGIPELDKCVLLCANCHRIRHYS